MPGRRFCCVGNSFVWGVDAEADERFTDLLRSRLSGFTIVNASVSGYGTDQEYLLLRRIWATIQPAVVVLIFCTDNDRLDNGTNIRYDGYQKPYFATAADGALVLRGQPVPISRQLYIKQNWLVRHLWLARVVAFAYVEIRHRNYTCPIRRSGSSARCMNSSKPTGPDWSSVFKQAMTSSFSICTPSEFLSSPSTEPRNLFPLYGGHWTPAGQKLVAERLLGLLSEIRVGKADSVSR